MKELFHKFSLFFRWIKRTHLKIFSDKQVQNLKRLHTVIDLLHPSLELIEINGITNFEATKGKIIANGLKYISEVAVADVWLLAGTECWEHFHKDKIKEWIICYEGEMKIYIKEKNGEVKKILKKGDFIVIESIIRTRILKVGDSVLIEPGEIHNVICDVDTKVIAITIPADENFPKNGK